VFRTFRCQSRGESAKRLAALVGAAQGPRPLAPASVLFPLQVAVMALQFQFGKPVCHDYQLPANRS